eukprot:6593165-Alexandrium_andersonii.AAC.1
MCIRDRPLSSIHFQVAVVLLVEPKPSVLAVRVPAARSTCRPGGKGFGAEFLGNGAQRSLDSGHRCDLAEL